MEGTVPIELTETSRHYNEYFASFREEFQDYWGQTEKLILEIDRLHNCLVEQYKRLADATAKIQKQIV